MIIPPGLVNTQTSFDFRGQNFRFDLCQSLFSSHAVDRGSALLLDALVPHLDARRPKRILDVGCGTGVLGIVLGGLYPGSTVRGTDRDALAVCFARRNARLNGQSDAVFEGALGTGDERPADCIVCNLPAKAGEPVLGHLIRSCVDRIETSGVAGIVIVRTLEEMASEAMRRSGAEIRDLRRAAGHSVLICSGKTAGNGRAPNGRSPCVAGAEKPADLSPYIRDHPRFCLQSCTYELTTVYGISDFDSLGHGITLTAETMLRAPRLRTVAIWNPGQGHLPVLCGKTMRPQSIRLIGRDLLALQISRLNLLQSGMSERCIGATHAAFPFDADGRQLRAGEPCGLLVVAPDPDPEPALCETLLEKLRSGLGPDAWIVLTARSSAAYRILRHRRGFRLTYERKKHGYRTALLARAG